MTHLLQHLSGNNDKGDVFRSGLSRLERYTGGKSVDTRLIADIIEKAHKVMRQLNLDIHDTTGHELYNALIATVKNNNLEDIFADTDYVLLSIDDNIISFNIIDIIENAHHGLKFGHQIVCHGQRSLRGEILERYISHDRIHESTAIEIASLIGLLPLSDACYNDCKYYKK
ncbi:MAG: hypothetical protein PWQ10_566 [Patescibacteria group bacterium]|nr:hypothetical protein [Patescibacteria group bacterium]